MVESSKANVVICNCYVQLAFELMDPLNTPGFTGSVFAPLDDLPTFQAVNNSNFYGVSAVRSAKTASSGMELLRHWIGTTGEQPSKMSVFTMQSWVGGGLVVDALKSCGYPCSGRQIQRALNRLGSVGSFGGVAYGPVGFTPTNHEVFQPFVVQDYVNSTVRDITSPESIPVGIKVSR